MHELLGSKDEKSLKATAAWLAFAHKDQNSFTDMELVEGKLATALWLFDLLLDDCRKGRCPDLQEHWCGFLDELSVSRCIEMKAYHSWRSKDKPFQEDQDSRDEDYMSACRDIWDIPNCTNHINLRLARTIQAYYGNRQEDMKNKKAFWQSRAKPDSSPADHFHESCGYVDALYGLLSGKVQPSDLTDFVRQNASMMSVLEFLYIGCKASSNS